MHDLTEADKLDNESGNLRGKGQYDKALLFAVRALALREKALGAEHPDRGTSLNNLATLYEATGDILRAVNFRSHAQAIEEHNISLNLATGSERQKLAYLKTLADATAYSVRLHIRSAPTKSDGARSGADRDSATQRARVRGAQ